MDACDIQKDNWDELEVTREEFDKLSECLKKEDFRKLFIEYAEEVSKPENRKLYQEEIIKLERERGVDVTFVNPEPGYVIKTSLNGDKKCFINISKNECVGKPTSQPSYDVDNGHRGLQWSIPHTLAPPRDDLDKKKSRCTVFDVVFNPDTLYLASKNPRFRDIVNNTALDSVENNFKVKLDRKNIRFPKINFKGVSQSSVIRRECEKSSESEESKDFEPEIYQKLISSYDEAREKYKKKLSAQEKPSRPTPATKYLNNKTSISEDTKYATPKYLIKHQTDLDLQDFRNAKDSKIYAATPKKLIIIIDLPLLRGANDATLDVQERLLSVVSEKPAQYRLELPLPYRVDPDHGSAKFDTSKKKLTVTLPVIREVVKLTELTRDDSGVESDNSPAISESSSIDTHESKIHLDDFQSIISNVDNIKASNGLISEITSVDCDKINLNTTDNSITSTKTVKSIINTNITYSLPHLNCNFYDNTIALVIDVKNVDADSICYQFLNDNTAINIVLVSIGAGFFPVHYALYLKLDSGSSFNEESINVEPWDNNVIVSITMKDADKMTRYFVGLNQEFLEARDVPHRISFTKKYEAFLRTKDEEQQANDNNLSVQVNRNDDSKQVVIDIKNNNSNQDHMDSDDEYSETRSDGEKRDCLQKCRSISESSGDELPDSRRSNKSRGILKYRRDNFSRSVSESSIDDTTGLVSSIEFNYDSVQEHYSESDCCSLKKTVRFNDVVSRQLFRSNSSILGRRKKNQRKLRKKKQAHERRMSESENSETEDRDKYKVNATNKNNKDEKIVDNNVKSILNRDKLSSHKLSDQENNYNNKCDNKMKSQVSGNRDQNLNQAEFKNDLIFDLDM
ncbi:protein kintoun [Microplitis mediator]|uniref:protein kintoun n=1 Tax=Microplitis mediator TaxID=375433 RepID=UPI0025558220|nr:protein kintoun [Microplitis mediator]